MIPAPLLALDGQRVVNYGIMAAATTSSAP